MRRRPRARRVAVAARRARPLIGAALALLALAGLGCRRGAEPAAALGPFPDAPVVLISIDTLRADHLPAYGYDRVATPAIDALRRDAVLFSRAWANYPLTLPSHVSMLTGLLPTEHGVRDN
ncbi:MAG TPA: sulfatase-like hydrolase/transferase, partial [Thermoanaerobaculia bacterium]|nr:sulfatase-like hydrolase/transferase [Thermoanaerobaculia bacterium]